MNIKNKLSRFFTKNSISKEDYAQIADENSPPPKLNIAFADSKRIIFAGLLVIGVFFGIGGIWVSVAEISGAVIASGEVRVDTERKTVQHLEGGIVKDILVRNGDKVETGQSLIVLDSSRIVAAANQISLQLAAAKLDDLRFQAEKNLANHVDWPQRGADISAEKFAELLDSARKVFVSGRRALENQLDLLKKQTDQLYQQDLSLTGRLVAEQKVVDTLQEELTAKLVLYEKNYIDKTVILGLQRAIAERQGQQAQLRGSQAELRERVAEFELRGVALENEYRQEAVNQQAKVQQRISDLQQQLMPLLDARQRLTISAPVAGEVVALQVHSVGGVISPGQPILDIVPHDSPLIVECHIQVKDITHVFKGQEADVQLVAFEQRTTPKILGRVVYISADRILQKTAYGEQPTYVVQVELDKKQLNENNLYLTAGMPCAVFIRTEPRTVLDYALEPLKENFDRALREN
ncbi:MAG: HlyD family type I secretion periplasmic adaptor subunit [Desulfuromonas sp.]|nr:HlyD family type I secretion periplasmic adaptor subunit [Desulfuromonas sp.]